MKKILLASLLVMCCTTVSAQVRELTEKRTSGAASSQNPSGIRKLTVKKNTFYVGPKVGATMTSISNPDECTLANGMGTSFSAGLVAQGRFGLASKHSGGGTGLFGAGIELKYKNNVAKTYGIDEDGNEDASLSIGYFEVPIYVHVYPFYKTDAMNTFYLEAGPDFALGISHSPKSLTVTDPNKELSSITYHFDGEKKELVGNDVRFMVGAGYEVPIKSGKETKSLVGIGARYYMGTSGLAGNFPCKMNTFELSLSWQFCLGKY